MDTLQIVQITNITRKWNVARFKRPQAAFVLSNNQQTLTQLIQIIYKNWHLIGGYTSSIIQIPRDLSNKQFEAQFYTQNLNTLGKGEVSSPAVIDT